MDVGGTIAITIRTVLHENHFDYKYRFSSIDIVQASSSKEFTFVETVKNCNCMDYLK